jgi:iron complex transport system substrate-binding protein
LPGATAPECNLIQHHAGETCVPLTPQRIVTLDAVTFEHAIALGMQPIATVHSSWDALHLQPYKQQAINIGVSGEPSLEKILALKPDLILGIDYQTPIYRQASQIAPTVISPFRHSGDWKDIFKLIAATLGKSEQAEQMMTRYYERLESFKVQMGDRLQTTEVSIVYLYPDAITVYTTAGFNGSILQDAGLARPAAQNLNAAATQQKDGESPIQYRISNELLQAADGDVIFMIVTPDDLEIGKTRQRLMSNPLWSTLKAVQQGRVYEVRDYWIGSGLIAANLVIDDLLKYLVVSSK